MSKHWDISEICASRVTAAGEKQVLVVWRPTWEPVTESLMNGAVWNVWMQEEAASKVKIAPVLAKAAATAENSESDEESAIEGAVGESDAGESDVDESGVGDDNGGEGDADEGQKKAGWEKINAFAAASTRRHSKKFLKHSAVSPKPVLAPKLTPKVTLTMTPQKRGRGRPPKNPVSTTKK
jgi:hypothetical protein